MSIFYARYEIRDTKCKKGTVLLFTLIVMISLISVVGAYIGFVQSSTKSIGAQIADSQAFYLAEAGLHKAIWYLTNTAPDDSNNGTWRTVAYPAEPSPDGNDPQQESLGEGTYTIWVEDSAGNVRITARGTTGNLSRTIEQTVTVDYGWMEIIYDEFESGFGNWTDGGADCDRYTGDTYAHQGSAAVNLQDDTDESVVSTGDLALSAYDDEIKVEFWYKAVGLSSGEDFWLQISTNGGGDYTTVQSWAKDIDFQNSTFYEESVTITGYSLTDQTRIRFRCDASNNGDDVYIDEIRVLAYSSDVGGEVTVENVVDTWQEL
jgi:Tfp pilus assembly protein PilX